MNSKMSNVALIFFSLCAFFCLVVGTPIPTNSTQSLEKRINHTGRGTWFNVGLGACGDYDVNSNHIVAISHDIYKGGGNCNQWMHVTNDANGKSVYVKTRDECESCGPNDIDLSPSAFQAIGNLDTGVLTVTWHFMAKDWAP